MWTCVRATTSRLCGGWIAAPSWRSCSASAVVGPDRASGERLAYVWSTPAGLLYVAELVVAHDAVPRFEQLHDDAVLMWHPQLGAYSTNWTTRRALDAAWREKGWREAPDGTPAPRQWRQQRSLVIRDLLDAEDVEHPPLRIKCSRDGEAVIDRHRLLGVAWWRVPPPRTCGSPGVGPGRWSR